MSADLHGSTSLTVTGTADMLDHGRDPEAVDELRITAGLRRGGSVRLTAEIARYKGDDADEISVEFTADLDAATCGRLGRMLLALADEREPADESALHDRLAAATARVDRTRDALESALAQLRDLSVHAQLLHDLAVEALTIDPGTGEIVGTPRGTVDQARGALDALGKLIRR